MVANGCVVGGAFISNFFCTFPRSENEISAPFPGKRAEISFSAWAEGGRQRADFTVKFALFSSETELGSNLSLKVDGHSCNLDGGAYWFLVVRSSKSQMIRFDSENFQHF